MNLWSIPPKHPNLEPDEVHVWRAALDVTNSTVEDLLTTLCTAERQRAGRFHFQKDRKQFIVARALLRIILGRYLAREPSELSFCYNQYGKPELLSADRTQIIHFNLSHARELALIAVAQNCDVGIDLEYIRLDLPWEEMAQSCFSPRERAILHQLPAAMKASVFFTVWTRKEAYIKATGKGLSLPLDQIDVSVMLGEPAQLLNVQWDDREASRWLLQELTPGSGYVAALATAAGDWQIKLWQWSFLNS
jgi:4'-phosphopantetheinyl transferase